MAEEFGLNFQDQHEIDITPEAGTATWARLGKGITSADPSNNEDVDQTKYLDGDGFGESEVIGMQKTISFSGHRVYGDPAQDYIQEIQETAGSGRKSTYRLTDAKGSRVEKECTIASIDMGGGDAGAKKDISFEIHLNGKPVRTPRTIAADLAATVSAGETAGTTTFTATPDGDNTLAYKLAAASAGNVYGGEYTFGLISYTAGDEIEAEVDQWLHMYELDENGRVVKFAEQQLEAADIG